LKAGLLEPSLSAAQGVVRTLISEKNKLGLSAVFTTTGASHGHVAPGAAARGI
jgi:hypothetical protein